MPVNCRTFVPPLQLSQKVGVAGVVIEEKLQTINYKLVPLLLKTHGFNGERRSGLRNDARTAGNDIDSADTSSPAVTDWCIPLLSGLPVSLTRLGWTAAKSNSFRCASRNPLHSLIFPHGCFEQ